MEEPGEPKKIEEEIGSEEERRLEERVEEERKRIIEEGRLKQEERLEEIRRLEKEERQRILEELTREKKEEKPEKVEIRPEVREQIIKEVFGGLPKELEELVGKGAPEDIQKRREIIEKYPDKTKEVLISLAFVDTAEADKLLEEHLGTGELQANWWPISRGLAGHTSKEAEEMRNWLEFDKEAGRRRGGRWFLALGGLRNSEWFFKLKTAINRSKILDRVLDTLKLKKYSSWLTPDDTIISYLGVITPESIEKRKKYIEETPLAVKKSLLGIPPGVSPEIDVMRRELKVEGYEKS